MNLCGPSLSTGLGLLMAIALLFATSCSTAIVPARHPCYPLLNSSRRPLTGIGYTHPQNATTSAATNRIYDGLLSSGARLSQISLTWAALEPVPGQFNYAFLGELMYDVRDANMQLMFNLATIDTNHFSLPPDLVDPNNPLKLANGLRWTDSNITSRYETALFVVAPLVAYSNGFHFGIGNEVDAALQNVDPSVAEDYAVFVAEMRQYVRVLTTTKMSVGVTFTSSGLRSLSSSTTPPPWFMSLVTVSDGIPVTYYPLEGNFSVEALATAARDINNTISALSSLGHCPLFQELGCPSGFGNSSSSDGSSGHYQAQFFNQSLQLLALPGAGVRGVSVVTLVDWSPQTCANYAKYYGVKSVAFLEYLCTLGIVEYNGTAKPALNVFTSFVQQQLLMDTNALIN